MDPKKYDRISDLLMQIRAELSQIVLSDNTCDNGMKQTAIARCDQLLFCVDTLATWDGKGWL